MYKVYLYQMVAILVLPFMALTSLRSLLAISLDALTALWEKGGMSGTPYTPVGLADKM